MPELPDYLLEELERLHELAVFEASRGLAEEELEARSLEDMYESLRRGEG